MVKQPDDIMQKTNNVLRVCYGSASNQIYSLKVWLLKCIPRKTATNPFRMQKH